MIKPNRAHLTLLASLVLLALLGCLAGCGSKGDLVRPATDASAQG